MSEDHPIAVPGYEIKRLIGQGGFAKVYLAEQKSLERDVALKVMDPKMVSDQDFCERFLKEGKTLAKLSSHPDILTIYDIGHIDSIYYMTMEYVGAPNLKERIKTRAGLERPLRIIRQVAEALGYVHQHDFIHRDVKPANVLFHENGSAVLADFGIAKTLKGGTQLTQVGFTVGTPEYMSPEQTLGKDLDGRADLYSLGVMFYELLTFNKPFKGKDPFATALKHLNDPVPRLPEEYAGYQECLERMLAKDPAERFANAAQLLEYLDHLEQGQRSASLADARTQQAALPRSREATVEGEGNRPAGKNWRGPAIVALAVVAAAAGGLAYLQPDSRVDSPPAVATVSTAADDSLESSPEGSDLSPEIKSKVARLLETAEAHEIVGRFTQPPGANALEAYQLVLELDPRNGSAQAGINRIKSGKPE